MKIYKVTDQTGSVHLVRAHTKAGARKFVTAKLRDGLHVKLPSQDELVGALQVGIQIEDSTVKPEPVYDGPLNPINQSDEE